METRVKNVNDNHVALIGYYEGRYTIFRKFGKGGAIISGEDLELTKREYERANTLGRAVLTLLRFVEEGVYEKVTETEIKYEWLQSEGG